MTTKKKNASAPAKTAKRAGAEPCGINDYKIEISILHQIIEIISNADSLSTLLHHIARALSRDLSYDSCLIYLLDRQTGDWVLTGAWPPHPYHVGKLRLESGEGITGWVAEHHQAVAIPKHGLLLRARSGVLRQQAYWRGWRSNC